MKTHDHHSHRCISPPPLFFNLKFTQLFFCVLSSLGRHHDEKGDMKDWWTKESNERFLELSKCMVNQYSNFTLDVDSGTHVNSACGILLPPH